jgi:pimeloyl-ACP methyl ester carboxylesterase
MHGMLSSGNTWDRMEPWLNRDFRFGTELTPSYDSTSSLSSQGTTLVNNINTNGGTGYILIGHSQGGLISRYAAQQYQKANQLQTTVKGVVTVDTPHKGANLIRSGSSLSPDLQYLGLALWYWVGCQNLGDNGACFLAWMVYNSGPYIGKGFDIVSGFPDLRDMTPGSTFLTSLNGYNENFIRAGIVGNTSQRWNLSRLAWDFLAPYDGIEVFCDPTYYPEGGCGERVVASVVGGAYDIVEALLAFAILEQIFDPNGNYIPDIIEYSGILFLMDGIDFYWNFAVTGGFYDSSDAIVQSTSQNYPSLSATQYPINGSDSHVENTHSPYDHAKLFEVLSGPQFKAPTQASCSFGASPSSYSVSASGGSGTFGVFAAAGCQWSAVSNAPWITITGGSSGTSAGNVSFSVAANPVTVPRIGTIQAGSGNSITTFSVSQTALCVYNPLPSFVTLSPGGGTATVSVTAGAGCVWSAVPNAPWLTITAGASGTGSGSFTLNAAPGTTSNSFSSIITVANQTVIVVVGSAVGTPGTGSVTISGSAYCTQHTPVGSGCIAYANGLVRVMIDGQMIGQSTYGGGSFSDSQVASNLTTSINGNSSSPVKATLSGTKVALTSKVNGAVTNYSLSTTYTTNYPTYVQAIPSGQYLTGGTD